MNFASNLRRDCDEIAAMLRVLRAAIRRLQQGGYVDPDMLTGLDRYLSEFVECHIRKCDVLVFPRVRALLPDETDRVLASANLYTECTRSLDASHIRGQPVHDGGTGTPAVRLALVPPRCLELLHAHIVAERRLLEQLRRRPADAYDERLVALCAQLERQFLGPTGREWYAQLVADYTDIVSTWT